MLVVVLLISKTVCIFPKIYLKARDLFITTDSAEEQKIARREFKLFSSLKLEKLLSAVY